MRMAHICYGLLGKERKGKKRKEKKRKRKEKEKKEKEKRKKGKKGTRQTEFEIVLVGQRVGDAVN